MEITMTEHEQLKSYLDKVLGFICGDIENLKSKGVTVSFPYLFLSFAGIDFLGGLVHGFPERNGNSRKRSSWFISTWMAKVNPQYSANMEDETRSLGSYLYSFARSGLFHMACVQRSIVVDADEINRQFHLCYSPMNGTTVFFHAIQFAEDFLNACDLFKSDLLSDPTKVHAAVETLQEYTISSITKEGSFSIPSLFRALPDQTNSTPPTFATGSVPVSH
jgi:hypothetical protein